MNGKIKYSGTEKIEKKIYDELEEKIETQLNAIAYETRSSIIEEIREELQPETVPYDRLRLIEQRIHEIATTQDGIVREIVDIKTTLSAMSKEMDKMRNPDNDIPPVKISQNPYQNSYQNPYESTLPETAYKQTEAVESPFSSYTPYPTAAPVDTRRAMHPPGFGNEPTGPATPIAPVTFNRKSDGWEYQEYVPKKNNAEPEKFVPAKTIPSGDDPFYFADSAEEILDVSPLREPEPPKQSSFENIPLTIQKVKTEEQEIPDRAEYIIGNNQKQMRFEKEDEDYNAGCEYIIAEKDIGSKRHGGRRGSKPASELKERIISSDEDDTEIITYE
ncbi:hypothetical protein MmiHf6_05890 [Methanimicrococcus hongohii]|uniref:Uncharacterized protein n=1 Tax=Methanimicrococcus hongohii TaxID=3028295 RepID=A0AA96ZSC7_9EURY|nr:hypothetical protein [Methanimicrococcus sp. Hf6]WNY23284.1 hypothetical protein MmiHf6_05890 [Methanimicrococcus sp. Hf6]